MNIVKLFSLLTICGLLFFSNTVVRADEDQVEQDADIDEEEEPAVRAEETVTPASDVLETKEDEDPNRIPSSPEFQTVFLFSQPPKANELIAGKLTRFLVGARNNGTQSFVVESIDGSLRYPQDFTYVIQNFTSLRSEKVIESGLESTFEYLFMPSETFNGRSMGLLVTINYRNNEGKHFQNVIFNQTINLTETDEGFDGETFFLYIFLGAVIILLGFVGYQYVVSPRVKRGSGKSGAQSYAGGQQVKGSYDPDWIPKHHLVQSRSPKKSSNRKSRQGNSDTNKATDVSAASAASSENDE